MPINFYSTMKNKQETENDKRENQSGKTHQIELVAFLHYSYGSSVLDILEANTIRMHDSIIHTKG